MLFVAKRAQNIKKISNKYYGIFHIIYSNIMEKLNVPFFLALVQDEPKKKPMKRTQTKRMGHRPKINLLYI